MVSLYDSPCRGWPRASGTRAGIRKAGSTLTTGGDGPAASAPSHSRSSAASARGRAYWKSEPASVPKQT